MKQCSICGKEIADDESYYFGTGFAVHWGCYSNFLASNKNQIFKKVGLERTVSLFLKFIMGVSRDAVGYGRTEDEFEIVKLVLSDILIEAGRLGLADLKKEEGEATSGEQTSVKSDPLQIVSKEAWDKQRREDLYTIITGYMKSGRQIVIAWAEEYNELCFTLGGEGKDSRGC